MRFTTFAFSGTGNTTWVVETFHTILRGKGHDAELIPIGDGKIPGKAILEKIRTSDFLGFASPIYGGDLAPVMKRFIERFCASLRDDITISKPIYFINTFGYINALGPRNTARLFADTYMRLTGYVNIRLCNNVSVPYMRSRAISREKMAVRKSIAAAQLEKLSDSLLAGTAYLEGTGAYVAAGPLVRRMFRKSIRDTYKRLGVHSDTCTRCMRCVKECPTQSISLHDLVFAPTCTACMRCYNICPTYSITVEGEIAGPKKYRRYLGPDA